MRSDVLPWQEASAASAQHRFIAAWLRGEETVADLCRRFGISRRPGTSASTASRRAGWPDWGIAAGRPTPIRYDPGGRGPGGDRDEAGAPDVGAEEGDRGACHRAAHGALARAEYGGRDPPAGGLVTPRRRHRRTAAWQAPFTAATAANEVWCMDFKGWFRTTDGTRIDPLTVQDAASRYLLACRGLTQPRGPQVRRLLERVLREYACPRRSAPITARRSPVWRWGACRP